jgi:hypothetical protein
MEMTTRATAIAIGLLTAALAACGSSQPATDTTPPAQPTAAGGDGAAQPDPAERASGAPADGTEAEPDAEPVATEPDDAEPVMTDAEQGRVIAFVKGMIAAVVSSDSDCAVLAPKVIELLTANGPFLQDLSSRMPKDEARAFQAEHRELMEAFGDAMQTIAQCAQNDENLAAAMQEMPPPPN